MPFFSDHKAVDWDALFTFLLTILVTLLGLGLPFLYSYLHTLLIAFKDTCQPNNGDFLVVFGKQLRNGQIDIDYRYRLDRSIEMIKKARPQLMILLGGPSQSDSMSEAKAGLKYLSSEGIDLQNSVQLEEQSSNTLENLQQARAIIESCTANPVTLISNRYHLARIRAIAQSLGLNYRLCPAESRLPISPSTFVKLIFEAYYILWFITGKTWARMTKNKRMLRRVT